MTDPFIKDFCELLKSKVIDIKSCSVKPILVIGFPHTEEDAEVIHRHYLLIQQLAAQQSGRTCTAFVYPLFLCQDLWQLREATEYVFAHAQCAPAMISMIGHGDGGTDDGSNISLLSTQRLNAKNISTLFFMFALLPHPENFKMAMFLNCDTGKTDRLVDQLKSLHPVTTLSFERKLFHCEVDNSIPFSQNPLSQFLVHYMLYMLDDEYTLAIISYMGHIPKHSNHHPLLRLMYFVAYSIASGFMSEADRLHRVEFERILHDYMKPDTFAEALQTLDLPRSIEVSRESVTRRMVMMLHETLPPMIGYSEWPTLRNLDGWCDRKWWPLRQPKPQDIEPQMLFDETNSNLIELWKHRMFDRSASSSSSTG